MTLKERYEGVINYFKTNVPVAETELNYSNPFELIVAVILSAQCTDKRINQVTPKLFKDYPTAEALASASSDTIFNYIRSVSYPNNKAKHLVEMAKMLLRDFNGVIPSEIDQLVKLPGVGRKTANVVASVIYDKPAMAVDTHVFRVSNRLGLTKAKTPLQSEQQLMKYIPKEYVATAHHWLILHGRYTCLARTPKCDVCPLTEWCQYFKTKVINKNAPHSLSTKKETMAKKETTTKKTAAKKAVVKKTATKKTTAVAPAKKNTTKAHVKEPVKADKFVAHSTSLKAGDKAPAFKAKDQNGKLISLNDLKGKNVILYFYPKDNTPTCTLEACSLRDEHQYLSKKNYVVLGVSADDEKMHKKFATKFELPFSLLADTDMTIIKAYDVWGIKQFMGKIYDGIIRTTFIINEKGVISHVITDVKSKEHGKQILEL
ncbi:MAG: endonuclease III [Bacteroidetes bacterium]|nr:endonuclease III [Bacteroidota bacterium]